MQKSNVVRWAAILFLIMGTGALFYLLFRYAVMLLLPFLLALLLAVLTRPLVVWIARKRDCSERPVALAVTAAALALLVLVAVLVCNRLLTEAQRLLELLASESETGEGKLSRLWGFFRDLSVRFPFLERLGELLPFGEDPDSFLQSELRRVLEAALSAVAGFLAGLLGRLPRVLLFLLVTVISSFFVAMDYKALGALCCRLLPARIAQRLPAVCARVLEVGKRYFKAYALLFLLTFGELLIGFLLLRTSYPVLLAFLVAFLDMLPVIGVGTVLVPWGLFCLLTGEGARAVWLLVLFLVIMVVRQILEPHILGKSLGVHPLLMLMGFYVGVSLFGVGGVILGPALAFGVRGVLSLREAQRGGEKSRLG